MASILHRLLMDKKQLRNENNKELELDLNVFFCIHTLDWECKITSCFIINHRFKSPYLACRNKSSCVSLLGCVCNTLTCKCLRVKSQELPQLIPAASLSLIVNIHQSHQHVNCCWIMMRHFLLRWPNISRSKEEGHAAACTSP